MLRKKNQKLKRSCHTPFFSGSVSFPYSPILYFPASGKWEWNLNSSSLLHFRPFQLLQHRSSVGHNFYQKTCAIEGLPPVVSSLRARPTALALCSPQGAGACLPHRRPPWSASLKSSPGAAGKSLLQCLEHLLSFLQ